MNHQVCSHCLIYPEDKLGKHVTSHFHSDESWKLTYSGSQLQRDIESYACPLGCVDKEFRFPPVRLLFLIVVIFEIRRNFCLPRLAPASLKLSVVQKTLMSSHAYKFQKTIQGVSFVAVARQAVMQTRACIPVTPHGRG